MEHRAVHYSECVNSNPGWSLPALEFMCLFKASRCLFWWYLCAIARTTLPYVDARYFQNSIWPLPFSVRQLRGMSHSFYCSTLIFGQDFDLVTPLFAPVYFRVYNKIATIQKKRIHSSVGRICCFNKFRTRYFLPVFVSLSACSIVPEADSTDSRLTVLRLFLILGCSDLRWKAVQWIWCPMWLLSKSGTLDIKCAVVWHVTNHVHTQLRGCIWKSYS